MEARPAAAAGSPVEASEGPQGVLVVPLPEGIGVEAAVQAAVVAGHAFLVHAGVASEGGNSSSSNSKNSARDGGDGADYYGSGSGGEKKSGEKENRKSRTKSKSNSRGQEMNDFETGQDEQQPMPEKRSSKPKRPDSASRRRESDRKEYNDHK